MNSEDRLNVFIIAAVLLAILFTGGSCSCMVHIKDAPAIEQPTP